MDSFIIFHIAMATTKQFYLLGEDPSTSREIDITSISDEDDLKHTVAAHFAIVKSSGMIVQSVTHARHY